ncbi:hypothetical protein [Sphingopyxis sp.]|uniref:hypothetical protein n=1 Tax=Sphingopyxis sp. TaxID=1908224 RepID=UPI001D45C0C5|nr:hypothetical protein [Sphingopyxis sp.]MBW8294298.1 hypothetical protein [Sphingopyxis sp.]
MKPMVWALMPVLVLGMDTSASAAKPKPKQDDKMVETAVVVPADASCSVEKKEKKKRGGLGGILRAARNSGLLNIVAGQTGTGGAVANSVAGTAIDVADASASARAASPVPEKPTC